MKFFKKHLLLIIIVILGFVLRIWGINFGLPYQFHQDEPIIINHAMAYGTGDLNPHFFAIPPLTSYLLFIVYGAYFILGRLLGIFVNLDSFILLFFEDPSYFYILGRLFIGVFPGVFSILAVFLLYRKLFNSKPGALFASSVIAFSFLPILHPHFIYTDTLFMLGVILAMLTMIKLLSQASIKNYILSGVMIGVATAIKYNAVILTVTYIAATHAITVRANKARFINGRFLLGGILSVVTFILFNPFALIDFSHFYKDIIAQSGATGYTGWFHHFGYSLKEGIGGLVSILGALGLITISFKDPKKGVFLISFPLVFCLHLVYFSQHFSRYVLPLVPFIAIGTGYFIFEFIIPKFKSYPVKVIVGSLLCLILIPSVFKSVQADTLLGTKDTRVEAAEWINKNISLKDPIAVDHTFFRPAIFQNETQLLDKQKLLDRQRGLVELKDKKLSYMLRAQSKRPGFYIYFLSKNPNEQGQFFSTMPALAFDYYKLKPHGIRYVVVNYSDRYPGTDDFYDTLKAKAKVVVSFSPYKDGKVRMSYDTIDTTCLSLMSKELKSRARTGPALVIYKI